MARYCCVKFGGAHSIVGKALLGLSFATASNDGKTDALQWLSVHFRLMGCLSKTLTIFSLWRLSVHFSLLEEEDAALLALLLLRSYQTSLV
jgi:hypothetical protein